MAEEKTEEQEQEQQETQEETTTEEETKEETAETRTVPESVAAELREDRRELREELARVAEENLRLKQQRQPAKTEEDEESPLAKLDPDVPPSAGDLLAHEKWKEQQQQKKTEAKKVENQAQLINESYEEARTELTAEKMGEGLDVATVLQLGHRNLTEGDKIDIFKHPQKSWQITYQRCIERTPALRARRNAISKAQATKTKTETKEKGKSEKETLEQETFDDSDPNSPVLRHLFGS